MKENLNLKNNLKKLNNQINPNNFNTYLEMNNLPNKDILIKKIFNYIY